MAENRYRKIEVRMWGDEKFRTLSPLLPSQDRAFGCSCLPGPTWSDSRVVSCGSRCAS